MYIQDHAFHHNQPCSGFSSMPDLLRDSHSNHTTWLTKKRKRIDDDDHPDFRKIMYDACLHAVPE